jgi:hypothetical protein
MEMSLSSYSVKKLKGKPRGRPRGWRKRNAEDEDLTTIRITRYLRNMIDSERSNYPRGNELRLTDILSKILVDRAEKIKQLTEQNHQLRSVIAKWRDQYAIIEE